MTRPTHSPSPRDLWAKAALAEIPKLLTLQDRNLHSPTYGCFDRNFWHYKIIDFPSGMAQEFVLPLVLAYQTNLPSNPFYQAPMLREWAIAGMHYAARSAHPDGSCDDYFPFERAAGAAAFSLFAAVESYQRLGLDDPQLLAFFTQRADWLAHHQESGRLTNHQALITLCLELLSLLLQTNRWDRAKAERLQQVLDWQNPEGWFQEYEGCDPGYHTLTISCLARLYQLNPNLPLKPVLESAVDLAAQFVHPDGSFGGEYTSRNTYNFFPHGFELMGNWFPAALWINDMTLQGLAHNQAPCYADDHIVGHHVWNYLLAWQDYAPERSQAVDPRQSRVWLPAAKILIDRREETELFLALNKGGCFKLFRQGKLVSSDTQFSLQVQQGQKLRNAVGHLVSDYEIQVEPDAVWISGQLGWAKQTQMTPLNLMILRVVMLTLGRFFPNLIRRLLQKMLIVGKRPAPYRFSRTLRWQQGEPGATGAWLVTDTLQALPGSDWRGVVAAGMGGQQTSIYVVMSRTFQPGQLQPWLDLTERLSSLSPSQPLELKRKL